jgi:hypothetical protein
VASVRADFVAYLGRTEGRLTAVAGATVASAVLVGVLGVLAVRDRQALLDDAVERRAVLTAAALDVYRAFADADASSLDVFDAADALREAAARDPDGASADRVRRLTDLVPEYVRLVETGWSNSHEKQPVGTSYLAQASFLVRDTILKEAEQLYNEQRSALAAAQRDAGRPPWPAFVIGALALIVFLAAQRFLFRRTRRRFNTGFVAATVLIATALIWLGSALAVTASNAEDSARIRDELVAPLAQARNLGRKADGNEAWMLIFPRVDDIGRLRGDLNEIERLIGEARSVAGPGEERDSIDQAAAALRSWRKESDQKPLGRPGTHTEVAGRITGISDGSTASYAKQLDQHLTAAIERYTRHAAAATASARQAMANLDVIIAGLTVLAAAAAVAGLWPRIAEYYR